MTWALFSAGLGVAAAGVGFSWTTDDARPFIIGALVGGGMAILATLINSGVIHP